MASIKETYKDQDITWGDGRVALAGTRLHSMLVGDMVRDAEEKHQGILDGYTSSIKSHVDNIEGLADDQYVEGFIAKRNGSGFDITPVDDARKIVLKKRLVLNRKKNDSKKKDE